MQREVAVGAAVLVVVLGGCPASAADPIRVFRDGGELQLNTYTLGSQSSPRVTETTPGEFVVVWHGPLRPARTARLIWYRHVTSRGLEPERELLVNDPLTTIANSFVPDVATQPSGALVVAWEDGGARDGEYSGIFAARANTPAARFQSDFQVNAYTTYGQYSPRVAALAAGEFAVVWNNAIDPLDIDAEENLLVRLITEEGALRGSETPVLIDNSRGTRQAQHEIEPLSSGGFVVVWGSFYHDGDEDGVFARVFDSDASPVAPPFQVNSYTTHGQRIADVASCDNGDFYVAWSSFFQDRSGVGVFGQRFDSNGNKIASEFRINASTFGDQTTPALATLSDCSLLAAWRSIGQDGDDEGVFGRWISADGASAGAEFQVNTYTTGVQGGVGGMVDIAATDAGTFIITWASVGQDGDSGGVYGQRFCAVPERCGKLTCSGLVSGASEPTITATDAATLLLASVGLASCPLCLCDTDASGVLTATDALRILARATGRDVELRCPSCDPS